MRKSLLAFSAVVLGTSVVSANTAYQGRVDNDAYHIFAPLAGKPCRVEVVEKNEQQLRLVLTIGSNPSVAMTLPRTDADTYHFQGQPNRPSRSSIYEIDTQTAKLKEGAIVVSETFRAYATEGFFSESAVYKCRASEVK